jgi:hypothetical protein
MLFESRSHWMTASIVDGRQALARGPRCRADL